MNAYVTFPVLETMSNDVSIDELVERLVAAKAEENMANQRRVALEEQIVERLGKRTEGAQTHELANGVKLTITGKLSYKADMSLLVQLAAALPENMRPIKTEVKLDETGAKYLRNNEPEAWARIAPAITTKEAKTSVEVKI
jgi:primosomal replication protein N